MEIRRKRFKMAETFAKQINPLLALIFILCFFLIGIVRYSFYDRGGTHEGSCEVQY